MPNLSHIISKSNKKKLQSLTLLDAPAERTCDCRDEPCPVANSCLECNVIYQAEVKRLDTNKIEKYVGLSSGPFKPRYRVHKGNIRNANEKGTKLSSHIWDLKGQNVEYELKWKYIAKAASYTPSSGTCNLCIKEIYFILYKKEESTLNSRSELFNPCPHRRKFKLNRN